MKLTKKLSFEIIIMWH